MEWLNIHIPILRAPEYIGSEPSARAAWLNVLAYCCEQENGGKILGGASWKDRQWQQTCGVTLAEVNEAHPLLSIVGSDVIVWKYPVEKEELVRERREWGKKGGRPAKKPRKNLKVNLNGKHPENLVQTISRNGREGEWNGMEGKENGRRDRCTLEEARDFAVSLGKPATDGEACFHKWEGNGWKNGNAAIKDWKATIRAWNVAGYLPSQKRGGQPAQQRQLDELDGYTFVDPKSH